MDTSTYYLENLYAFLFFALFLAPAPLGARSFSRGRWLDRIPQEGEQTEVEYEGYGFKILQVENKMIHTIRKQRLAPPPDTPSGPENGGESPVESENSLPD